MLMQFIVAVLAQTASPPPPLTAIEDWSSYAPIANSDRVSVVCPEAGRVTAEFDRQGYVVSVVAIEGFSRRLSKDDRSAINAAIAPLHVLDRVEIGCNGPNEALIHVLGGFEEANGKMMRQVVPMVWGKSGLRGVGGSILPRIELSPNLR